MKKEKYKLYKLLGKQEKDLQLGKKIVDEDYEIIKILKDTKRNYVAVIQIEGKKYILKEFRSEIVIPQRKIQTILKKGEAINTLVNGIEAIDIGIEELAKPLVAIVMKKIMIKKSYLLMEYIDGENLKTIEDIDEVIKIIKKIHLLGRYHGDLNTSNFIKSKNKIMILDTQMKREQKIFFKRAYDIFTLKEDLLVKFWGYDIEKKYNVPKGIFPFLAKAIKELKKTKFIKKIREIKSKLREKGIKI